MSDLRARTNEIGNKITSAMSTQQQKMKESLSSMQDQIQNYNNQVSDYLKTIDTDIQDYKFSVEKVDEGIAINVMFKAIIKKNGNMIEDHDSENYS